MCTIRTVICIMLLRNFLNIFLRLLMWLEDVFCPGIQVEDDIF